MKRDWPSSESESESQEDEEHVQASLDSIQNAASSRPASLDQRLDGSNKGFQLLAKLGWTQGGLGSTRIGREDPVPFALKVDQLGLGKAEVETETLANTTLTQRRMASVMMLDESEADRAAREAKVEERKRLQQELAETLKTYYCELCDKQFRNIRQYDEHLRSYDHHHRKRFKEMRAEQRTSALAAGDVDKRREKEKRREAKELAKLGGAGGMLDMVPTPAPADIDGSAIVDGGSTSEPGPMSKAPADDENTKSFAPSSSSQGGFRKIGAVAPPSTESDAEPIQTKPYQHFRSSGFVTLDTGSSPMPPSARPIRSDSIRASLATKPPNESTGNAKAANALGSDSDEGQPSAAPAAASRPRAIGRAPGGIKIGFVPPKR